MAFQHRAVINNVSRAAFNHVCDAAKDRELKVDISYNGTDLSGVLTIEGRGGYSRHYYALLKLLVNECFD